MEILKISGGGRRRAQIFFAGFACGKNFAKVLRPDLFYGDAYLVFDYRKIDFSELLKIALGYSEVEASGWSFGVWAAAKFCKMSGARAGVAVCGSTTPVSDILGIPRKIFNMTLSGFSDPDKFFSRACGGDSGLKKFFSGRSASELKRELESFAEKFFSEDLSGVGFARAFASKNDAIFPISNLRRAFGEGLSEREGGHLNPKLIEEALLFLKNSSKIREGFERSSKSYASEALVQSRIARKLAGLIERKIPEAFCGKNFLEIGCGVGFLTGELSPKGESLLCLNDLSENLCGLAASRWKGSARIFAGDFLSMDFENLRFDSIFSASCFHWIEDREALFSKLKFLLKDGGFLAFSTFGKKNLKELLPFLSGVNYSDAEEIQNLLEENGFETEFVLSEEEEMEFGDPVSVLRHLKATGVNSKFASFWTRGKLEDFRSKYPLNSFGKAVLTYNPIYVLARKPHR